METLLSEQKIISNFIEESCNNKHYQHKRKAKLIMTKDYRMFTNTVQPQKNLKLEIYLLFLKIPK